MHVCIIISVYPLIRIMTPCGWEKEFSLPTQKNVTWHHDTIVNIQYFYPVRAHAQQGQAIAVYMYYVYI